MLKKTRITIIGNGFGGVYTLKNLYKIMGDKKDVEITLIGDKNYFLFTPLLHEVATGGISSENIIEPIRKVLGRCFSNFHLGQAKNINFSTQTVQVKEEILPYDYLVLAPGAETNFYNTKGASEFSLTLKTIEDALKIKNKIITQIENASHISDMEKRKKALTFVVIGGGPTGVELAAELQEFVKENFSKYFKKEIIESASVVLIQRNTEILPKFNKKIRTKSLEFLRKKGLIVWTNTTVKEVGPDYVVVDDNRKINTDTMIWVAGVKPKQLDIIEEIDKTKDGKIIVNEFLQLEKYKNVFALGDGACFLEKTTNIPLPALAQVSEKQSKVVAKNIILSMKNKSLDTFIYKSSGNIVSLGQWMAIGEILNFSFWGRTTWWFWRTIYLSKLISFRKKIRVAMDWTTHLFSTRDISKI